ncbi:MAG: beta-galactosidase trimerization domain-containing protein [Candidatus Omnitrophica bacterium]|nr:beta-galactosidase trimerization domain-containing protein [Candidatus Omnitrophota bacterium]
MLAYDKGGPDSTALQHAEAAAFGGVCVLHKPHVHGPHHDIQRRYQRFFDEHEEWYQGYESAAQVGLLFLWEQVHFNNQAHLEAAYEIHEMLGRRQIPFDLVIEENLDRSRLSRYKVLVAPGVRYLSDSQLQVLRDYVEEGGRLILIMPFADFDLAARPRHELPEPFNSTQKDKADRANGGVLILESLSEALPDPGIPFEKALQAAQGGDLRNAFPSDKVGEAAFYLELDRRFGLKRHQSRNPVIEEIHKAFQGPASILDPEQGEDIRAALYRHPDRGDLVLHLINYRVPMQGRKRGRCLRPQENLVVTVSLPAHDQPPLVRTASPGGPDIEIQNVNLQGETLTITLPILRDYALVRIPG